MDKYRVTLTEEERTELEQVVSRGKAAARKLTHARILLLADDARGEERPDEQIVAALGTSLRTVSRVRHLLVTQGMSSPCCAGGSRLGPIRSRSRETSSGGSSSWPVVTRPRAAATGRCNCWPTSWSSWAWSIGSASSRSGWR